MMLSRALRAGQRVLSGPSGSPPVQLRGFEVVDADPNGPPVLDRPQVSTAVRRDGNAGWIRGAGAWISIAALGAVYAATNAFGYLIAIGPYLSDLIGSLAAGWRAPVIVHDAAFNAASITVAGLSSAKRYRWELWCDTNGGLEDGWLRPNGAAAGSYSSWIVGSTTDLLLTETDAALPSVAYGSMGPRRNGRSIFASTMGTAGAGTGRFTAVGSTTTDFTSLQFVISASARTGWLTVIEDSP